MALFHSQARRHMINVLIITDVEQLMITGTANETNKIFLLQVVTSWIGYTTPVYGSCVGF